jgi:hypothetical protein
MWNNNLICTKNARTLLTQRREIIILFALKCLNPLLIQRREIIILFALNGLKPLLIQRREIIILFALKMSKLYWYRGVKWYLICTTKPKFSVDTEAWNNNLVCIEKTYILCWYRGVK